MKIIKMDLPAAQLGECPLWDHRTNRLCWVDSFGMAVWRHDPVTQVVENMPLPELVGSLGLRTGGAYIVALQSGVYGFDFQTGALSLLVDPEPDRPNNRLNDGCVGPDGAFWVTSHCDETRRPTAGFYRIDPDLTVLTVDDGLTLGNGTAFSPDGKRVYYADTPACKIYTRQIEAEAMLGPRKLFSDFSNIEGRPDGAAIDAQGNYWSALVRGGAIGCFDPSGRLIRSIALPVKYPTMCAFGGPDLTTLFVTTTAHLLTEPERTASTHDGGIFAITELGVAGMQAFEFFG